MKAVALAVIPAVPDCALKVGMMDTEAGPDRMGVLSRLLALL